MHDMALILGRLPRMMLVIYSDTMEPRNAHGCELSEDATIFPPSRPLTEPTPVAYMIAKGRLFRALGRVADFNNNPSLVSYDAVLKIDNSVYDAYQNFPPHMNGYGGGEHFNSGAWSMWIVQVTKMYSNMVRTSSVAITDVSSRPIFKLIKPHSTGPHPARILQLSTTIFPIFSHIGPLILAYAAPSYAFDTFFALATARPSFTACPSSSSNTNSRVNSRVNSPSQCVCLGSCFAGT